MALIHDGLRQDDEGTTSPSLQQPLSRLIS